MRSGHSVDKDGAATKHWLERPETGSSEATAKRLEDHRHDRS